MNEQMTNASLEISDQKRLIERIDKELSALWTDIQKYTKNIPSLLEEFSSQHNRLESEYSRALKAVALDELKNGSRPFKSILNDIYKARYSALHASAKVSLDSVERVLKSPFWYGERGTYQQPVSEIRQQIKDLEKGSSENSIEEIKAQADKLNVIVRQIEDEEKRARIRLPIQVFIWGLPVFLGLWVSNKFSTLQNSLLALSLAIAVLVAYLLVRFRIAARISMLARKNKLFDARRVQSILIYIPAVLIMPGYIIISEIEDYIVNSRMHVSFGPPTEEIVRGKKIEIPYEIEYYHELPAVDVTISADAPGLKVLGFRDEINALASGSVRDGLVRITVPEGTPAGVYRASLTVRYEGRSPFPFRSDFDSGNVSKFIDLRLP